MIKNKYKPGKESKYLAAFTIVELMVVVIVIGILASIITFGATTIQKSSRDSARDAQVQIIANALEKYYRNNGEYPSVATMTSSDVSGLKQKLGISNASVFKLPLSSASATTSIATSNPSTTTVVYSANTTDTTKNSQCQTDANGYCDGFTLAYVKEANGATQTIQSLNSTFVPVVQGATCNAGDTQNGSTCTHTYTGTYQAGGYTCPNGGTLSGTTCTSTYAATYSAGSYYCSWGHTSSGSGSSMTCSYPAQTGSCPSLSYNPSGSYCLRSLGSAASPAQCPGGTNYTVLMTNGTYSCYDRQPIGTYYQCNSNPATLSGSTCTYSAFYSAPYYYCNSGDTLNGSTCTNSYAATQSTGYYTCPNGGTANGSTCSYTYQLQG